MKYNIPLDICYLVFSFLEYNCNYCDIAISGNDLLNSCCEIKKTRCDTKLEKNNYIIKTWFEHDYNLWFGSYFIIICQKCTKTRCKICLVVFSDKKICSNCI